MTDDKIDVPPEPMKLTDLIKTGEEVEIDAVVGEKTKKFKIWIRKPTPGQHTEATEKARGKARRARLQYKDKKGDAYQALMDQIDVLSDEDLIAKIVQFDEADIKQAAYHKVLYGHSQTDWSEKGLSYLDLMTAIRNRMNEIVELNEDADIDADMVALGEDPELKELLSERQQFEDEVDEVINQEIESKRENLRIFDRPSLEEQWASKFIDLEANMAWFEAYKLQMVYHACRDPEFKDQLYFESPSQIQELPFFVSSQILEAYDRIDKGVSEIKNLHTPLLS